MARVIRPELRHELLHMGMATFFREAYASMARVTNSFAALREVLEGGKGELKEAWQEVDKARLEAERAREEAEAARAEAEGAVAQAEEAKAALEKEKAEKTAELRAAVAKAETEATRARSAFSRMCEAENAIEARDLHIVDLTEVLKEMEEGKKKAISENEELQARLQASEVAAEARAIAAVEEFRSSECFTKELADASADAFLRGFDLGKERVAKVLGIPQALEVELEPDSTEAAGDDGPADT